MTDNPHLTRRWPFGRVTEGLPTIQKLERYSCMEIRWQAMSIDAILNRWKKHLGNVPASV
jgi:hypothetical protein